MKWLDCESTLNHYGLRRVLSCCFLLDSYEFMFLLAAQIRSIVVCDLSDYSVSPSCWQMELLWVALVHCLIKSALTPNRIWLFPGIMGDTVFLL